MHDSERLTILVGLLDFFSDRAMAHASFVVATIFGMYTILFAKINAMPSWEVLILAYIALIIIDVYSFLNFGYYATLASITRHELQGYYKDEIKKMLHNNLKKRHKLHYGFQWFRSGIAYKPYIKFGLLFVLWLSAVITPFLAIFFNLPRQVCYVVCFFIMTPIIISILILGFLQGYILEKKYGKTERT